MQSPKPSSWRIDKAFDRICNVGCLTAHHDPQRRFLHSHARDPGVRIWAGGRAAAYTFTYAHAAKTGVVRPNTASVFFFWPRRSAI
jgi:hypothetical protein